MEFLSGEGSSLQLRFVNDSNVLGDGIGGFLNISSDHNDGNTGFSAFFDGRGDFFSGRVSDGNDSDENRVGFELSVFGVVFEQGVGGVVGSVVAGQLSAVFFVAHGEGSESLFGVGFDFIVEGLFGSGS